jgi:cytidylate kinase
MSVITISRQYGAGGKTIGSLVAKRIGYHMFDDEILQEVSRKARVSKHWVESVEKEAGGKFQRFISGMVPKNLIERILDSEGGYIDEEIYIDLLYKVITRIADEGDAIIIGRGGQYILEDFKNTYHVLLIADKLDRIKFMEDNYNLSSNQAVKVVGANDKKRANLYKKFGKEGYDSHVHYNMVINTSELTIDKATDLICKLAD